MLDILIHNGTILDGTGNPGFKGAVGITEDTISLHRGDISNVESQRYIAVTYTHLTLRTICSV